MKILLKNIANSPKLRASAPLWLRNLGRSIIPAYKYNLHQWAHENPYVGTPGEFSSIGSSSHKLGILQDFGQEHKHYIAACSEMGVSYEVINFTKDNWIDLISQSDCDAFLAWPMNWNSVWKKMWDDRLNIIVKEIGKTICPSLNELWLYESKSRTRDWLKAHNLPHPRTWIFYSEDEALTFIADADFPLIFKTDVGASSHGVFLCHSRNQARALIRKAFAKGVVSKRSDTRDKQWGVVIFQEYLEDVQEWRLIRVGDSYFCRYKIRKGDFHSGSGEIIWAEPPMKLLNETRRITDSFGFTSLNIDFFETKQGQYLINELHAVFGGKILPDCDLNGRYLYDNESESWKFERGDFFRNQCANLRVEYLLQRIADAEKA